MKSFVIPVLKEIPNALINLNLSISPLPGLLLFFLSHSSIFLIYFLKSVGLWIFPVLLKRGWS